jgi:hypothetical protein
MHDPTENTRREMVWSINSELPSSEDARRVELESIYGKVWDTDQLRADFTVTGFAAPMVVVTEKATGRKGSLFFCHSPRFYFNFEYV